MFAGSWPSTMITEKVGSYSLFMLGFQNARVNDPEKVLKNLRTDFRGVELQLLRADRLAGKEHLLFAARNAVDSFKGKDRRAKHLSMEILLFTSGEHQIVEAIRLLGVTPATTELVVVGLSETRIDQNLVAGKVGQIVGGVPDDSVIDLQNANKVSGLKKAYKISDRELASTRVPNETEEMALQRLVIERSAILVLEN